MITCPEVRSFSPRIFMTPREAVDNARTALERAQRGYFNDSTAASTNNQFRNIKESEHKELIEFVSLK